MKTFWISEAFVSIQGEGLLTGVPSYFIRTAGCNLRCHFCDTPYASWKPEGERLTLEALLQPLEQHPKLKHVVITGGEPTLQEDLPLLLDALKERGCHLTIETAGTLFRDWPQIDFWSISPKLASSTPSPEKHPEWARRHEKTRYQPEVLKALIQKPHQLKFVVEEREDLDEIQAMLLELGIPDERVYIMPEGVTTEVMNQRSEWLVKEVIERGWRYCDRLHIRLFGDTKGT